MPARLAATALRASDLAVKLGGRSVLRGVEFELESGSTLAVIGQSGSGKTTLLRALAGLIDTASGRIEVGDRQIQNEPAHRRGIVYMNQEPLLFPHLNVRENIAFGLRMRRRSADQIAAVVDTLIAALGLSALQLRDSASLSGGERQRVAFVRALAVEPAVLLLDEPFASLDPGTRISMQGLFRKLSTDRGIAAIFVTHDLKECLRVGDRFAAIRDGVLRLYSDRTAFCADPDSGVAAEAEFWSAALGGRP